METAEHDFPEVLSDIIELDDSLMPNLANKMNGFLNGSYSSNGDMSSTSRNNASTLSTSGTSELVIDTESQQQHAEVSSSVSAASNNNASAVAADNTQYFSSTSAQDFMLSEMMSADLDQAQQAMSNNNSEPIDIANCIYYDNVEINENEHVDDPDEHLAEVININPGEIENGLNVVKTVVSSLVENVHNSIRPSELIVPSSDQIVDDSLRDQLLSTTEPTEKNGTDCNQPEMTAQNTDSGECDRTPDEQTNQRPVEAIETILVNDITETNTNSNNNNTNEPVKKRARVACKTSLSERLMLIGPMDMYDNESQFHTVEEDYESLIIENPFTNSSESWSSTGSANKQPPVTPKPVNSRDPVLVPVAKSPGKCIVRYRKKRMIKVTRELRVVLVKETLDANNQVIQSRVLMDKTRSDLLDQSEREKIFGEKKVTFESQAIEQNDDADNRQISRMDIDHQSNNVNDNEGEAGDESIDDECLSPPTDDLDTADEEERKATPKKTPTKSEPPTNNNRSFSVSKLNASCPASSRPYKTHRKLLFANRYVNGHNGSLSDDDTVPHKPRDNQGQLNLRNRSVAKKLEQLATPSRNKDECLKHKYKLKYGKEATESVESNDAGKSKICSFSELRFKLTPKERRDDLDQLRKATSSSSNAPLDILPDTTTPMPKLSSRVMSPAPVSSSTFELNPDCVFLDGGKSLQNGAEQIGQYLKELNTFLVQQNDLIDVPLVEDRRQAKADEPNSAQKRSFSLKNVAIRVQRLDEQTFQKYYSKLALDQSSSRADSVSSPKLSTSVDGPLTQGEYVFAQMPNGNYHAAQIETIKDYFYADSNFGLLYKCKYFNFKNDRELEPLLNDENMTRSRVTDLSTSGEFTVLDDSDTDDFLTQSQLVRAGSLRKNEPLLVYNPKLESFKVAYFVKISGFYIWARYKLTSTVRTRFPFQMVVIPKRTIESRNAKLVSKKQPKNDETSKEKSRKSRSRKRIIENSSTNNTSNSSTDSNIKELRSSSRKNTSKIMIHKENTDKSDDDEDVDENFLNSNVSEYNSKTHLKWKRDSKLSLVSNSSSQFSLTTSRSVDINLVRLAEFTTEPVQKPTETQTQPARSSSSSSYAFRNGTKQSRSQPVNSTPGELSHDKPKMFVTRSSRAARGSLSNTNTNEIINDFRYKLRSQS